MKQALPIAAQSSNTAAMAIGIASLFGIVGDYKRILTLHHLFNTLLAITFYVVKIQPTLCNLTFGDETECHIDAREHQIFIFLCFVIFWKNRKATSWFHYVSNVFVFAKLANLILFYRVEPRAALVYGVACVLVTLLLPEPAYAGPERVVYFRGPHLKEELDRSPKTTWLIEFYVSWSPQCQQVASVFAQLSEKYTLPNLKFGKLDVGRFGDEAARFRVNAHPTSRQLPTFSLFQGGKEVKRRPIVNQKGRAIPYTFSQENIVMDFDLNNLYEECKRNLSKTEKDAMEEAAKKKDK